MSLSRHLIPWLAAASLQAADPSAPVRTRVFTVAEENDKFSPTNKDRYYTQGLRFALNREDGVVFSLTQEINTPSDTANPNPPVTDQPYTGALYAGWGFGGVLERGGRRDCMYSLEAKVGVIGPSAGGETIQNRFHDLIGTPDAAGWGTQVPDELMLNLDGEFRRRFDLAPGSRDLIARGMLELGTLRSEAILGAQFRWGSGLDRSWGHSFLRQSNAYEPIVVRAAEEGSAYWFFADAQTEVVVRNYAMDGTNFRESRGVTRRPIVLQCSLGATYRSARWSASYFLAMRTKEFETQAEAHAFGGLRGDFVF